MRRRWLLIMGGVVALCVITVFALALLVPRAPFRFLDGQEALPMRATASEQRALVGISGASVYSFPAEYPRLLLEARTELGKLGYREASATWVDGVSFDKGKKGEGILILHDARVEEISVKGLKQAQLKSPGWVTVVVSIPPPNWWDEIKAVFGL